MNNSNQFFTYKREYPNEYGKAVILYMDEEYTQRKQINIDTGLTSEQVNRCIEEGLVNIQPDTGNKTTKQIVMDNVLTFFNLINIILAILLLIVGSFKNMMFLSVIFWNTCIGIFQELRAKRTLDKLSLITASKVRTIRDGNEQETDISDIVLDDIMVLSSGNQICTDAVLRKGMLEVNESLLTGESDTIVKNPGDFLYSGSYVISGRAYAQVEHVGADNFAQKITSEAKTEKRNPSELRKAMDWILKIVSIIIVPLGIGLFVIQYYTANTSFADSIIGMVAAVIGMLPEGLVLLTSIALAVGAVNLGRRDVLVHELFCIETLARVDMLCLDKTGTITEGKMQVEDVITLSDNISVNEIMGNIVYVMQDDNSTFQAFKAHFTPCNSYQANLIIPFSSARKYSGAVFEEIGTYIMGAFEFLFSEDAYPEIKEQVNKSATEGIRVITLAHSPHIAEGTNLPPELEPCALILISDIIRENAEETFRYFAEQDVQLMIISGDHPATVSKVAARAGFSGAQEFVDASTLRTTEEIREAVKDNRIFGRVTPEQKKKIVEALQTQGYTVAMTGDGVNDVPALKQADCSIVMAGGSDAAKNCSNMVLLNSDFASMPYVMKEGRRVINNIQSAASLFLVKTIFSFISTVLMLCFQMQYPFEPIHLTIISCCAIGIPSFILSMEPNYEQVKAGFLRHVIHNALTGAFTVVFQICIISFAASRFDFSDTVRSTMCVIATGISCLYMVKKVFSLKTGLRKIVYYTMFGLFFGSILVLQELLLLSDLPYRPMIMILIQVMAVPHLITFFDLMLTKAGGLWMKTKSKFNLKWNFRSFDRS